MFRMSRRRERSIPCSRKLPGSMLSATASPSSVEVGAETWEAMRVVIADLGLGARYAKLGIHLFLNHVVDNLDLTRAPRTKRIPPAKRGADGCRD